MRSELKAWQQSGSYIAITPFQHRMFVKEVGSQKADPDNTLLLIHGFPESSYSFYRVLSGLQERFERIVLCDMPGYGLSDKPEVNYTYSLFEQADAVLSAWKSLGVTGGHVLCHDMGCSVTTEILARHEQDLLPRWLSPGIQSVTFTNGSLVLSMAKLRIMQRLLLSNYGKHLRNLVNYRVFSQQIRSAHGNNKLSEEDIRILWENNTLQEGHRKTYLVIRYLKDRMRFEASRWLPALSKTKLSVHLCWGDADMVARHEMAVHLKEKVVPRATLTTMQGVGHFCQLGSPDIWLESVLAWYEGAH